MLSYSVVCNSQLSPQTNPTAHDAVVAVKPTPEFTSKSRLLLVPVIVTGRNGAHVGGLGRVSFRIEEQ
jgi:hypothetical protein